MERNNEKGNTEALSLNMALISDAESSSYSRDESEWKIASKKNNKERIESRTTVVLPSQVRDERFVYFPPRNEDSEVEEDVMQGGKWMIFLNGELDLLDKYWTALQPLYESGILSKLKSTTAIDSTGGLINCYTADAENMGEVRRAADSIRIRIDYEYAMLYKTNQSSVEGKYQSEGKKYISKYLHTKHCGFYVRDKYHRWKLTLD